LYSLLRQAQDRLFIKGGKDKLREEGTRGKPTASQRFSPSPLVPLPSRERGKRKGDILGEIERDFAVII
jgi:hypothetical protein